ncbi:SH3 domain-containing protein [Alloacidobacterium dinghuense]|uniref:SH3 domain-containing protein n=1 Tax=Alloacidobacterium dinghuense TaxID=2763107 RepID=A0A7G8BHX9_9BACT|nr:SH3 domain-containing protein [Alloacidobacterium dinghuense]QNI32149.1 SH3 domain-containing protein [Alloacidobacterium dinghuense]
MGGCNRLRPKPAAEYVYVVAKETFLRDRVAAVSNRVANVTNGQRLQVVEKGRRFLKVKTDKGEIGWIEEHGVIDQDAYQQFADLAKQHANDPVISTATLRDDLYLHVKPGRQTDRFYLLPENDKLQMLVRASVPKDAPPQAAPVARKPVVKTDTKAGDKPASPATVPTIAATPSPPAAPVEPPALEDWWLVRDTQGRVGWMLSRRLDVDVPDSIAGYAEGQRIVGAYKLTTVSDPESSFPNGQVPEFVTVMSPYKDGLPYDFDQVRIFTWNVRKHRYETAYRQRNLQGYLPVQVGTQAFDKIGTVPVFSLKTATDDTIAIDPATGAARPANLTTQTFRLEGVIVRKVEPPSAAPPPPLPSVAPQASRETGKKAAKHHGTRAKHPKHH